MTREFAHVRWIGGGTGAGKSTVTGLLARGREVTVYDGDAGEAGYLARCTPEQHPLLHALAGKSPAEKWLVPTPEEVVAAMPSLHGETFPLVLEDLRALPADRPLLVDDFRTLPREVAPLLARPGHAAFLLPDPDFLPQTPSGGTPILPRCPHVTPTRSGPVRTGGTPIRPSCWNWGSPPDEVWGRLARDLLWDAEIRRQAEVFGLPVIEVDGREDAGAVAGRLADAFF